MKKRFLFESAGQTGTIQSTSPMRQVINSDVLLRLIARATLDDAKRHHAGRRANLVFYIENYEKLDHATRVCISNYLIGRYGGYTSCSDNIFYGDRLFRFSCIDVCGNESFLWDLAMRRKGFIDVPCNVMFVSHTGILATDTVSCTRPRPIKKKGDPRHA